MIVAKREVDQRGRGALPVQDRDPFLSSRPRATGSYRHVCMRQIEFPATVEANLVRAVFDREHTAEVTMPAAKNKLEDVQQEFHKSCARWRRSQLPLASSHSSRE
jgi:hypothetical protein